MKERLENGAPVVYWGSLSKYHGGLYTVIDSRLDRWGDWRYDLEPLVSEGPDDKSLYWAHRESLEAV